MLPFKMGNLIFVLFYGVQAGYSLNFLKPNGLQKDIAAIPNASLYFKLIIRP